jgi:hypothetical protein
VFRELGGHMIRVAFILFHTGETRALLPAMLQMAARPKQYCLRIIPVGQVAKNNLPELLLPFIQVPRFIQAGEGQNDAYKTSFPEENIQEVLEYCDAFQHIVMGVPSKIQAQIAQALPRLKQRIAYIDIGADVHRINAFLKHVDMFIVTSLMAQKAAQTIVMQSELEKKPRVLAGRNGDFDTWREQYTTQIKNIETIQAKLCIHSTDKVLLWAGGYGDASENDAEKLGFIKFIEAFLPFKNEYKLKIAIHPGLKSYPSKKLNQILEDYYINPLSMRGFSEKEAHKMVTQFDAFSVACVAHGVISIGSMVAPQAVSLGVRAKTVFVSDNISPITGIKTIRIKEEWQEIFNRWLSKERRIINSEIYDKAIKKLSIPKESTFAILELLLSNDKNQI